MLIREYKLADRRACIEIFNSNVPNFFASEELKDFEVWLDSQDSADITSANPKSDYYYVVEKDNRLIACGGFYLPIEHTDITMVWGMVKQALHRQGLGRQFLEYRIRQIRLLRPDSPIVLDTTQYSYPFFEKLGFTVTKVTKDYYAKGLDRYDMVC